MSKPRGKRSVSDGQIRVHGKAANGLGSTYYDPKRERWVGEYRNVAQKRFRVTAKTQEKARARLDAKIAAAAGSDDQHDPNVMTFAELSAKWMASHERTVSPSSMAKYSARVQRINRSLGEVPVAKVSMARIERWMSEIGKNFKPSTVADHLTTLKMVLNFAVDLGLLPKSPAAKVKPPRIPREKRPTLDVEQVRRFLAAAESDPLYAAAVILFVVGLRASEVLGLRWSDIDLDGGKFTVTQAVKEISGSGIALGPTKTAGALGIHPLPDVATQALRTHKVRQDKAMAKAGDALDPVGDGLVFRSQTGGLVSRQMLGRAVKRICASAGIDAVGISTHTGRRTVVTQGYLNGISLDDLARHVGHSNTSTTEGYVHDLGQRPERTAERISRLFEGGAQ